MHPGDVGLRQNVSEPGLRKMHFIHPSAADSLQRSLIASMRLGYVCRFCMTMTTAYVGLLKNPHDSYQAQSRF